VLFNRTLLDCKSVAEEQCHRLFSCSVYLTERCSMVVGCSSGQAGAINVKSVSRKETVTTYLDVPRREHKVRATCVGPSHFCPLSYTLAEGQCRRLKQSAVLAL